MTNYYDLFLDEEGREQNALMKAVYNHLDASTFTSNDMVTRVKEKMTEQFIGSITNLYKIDYSSVERILRESAEYSIYMLVNSGWNISPEIEQLTINKMEELKLFDIYEKEKNEVRKKMLKASLAYKKLIPVVYDHVSYEKEIFGVKPVSLIGSWFDDVLHKEVVQHFILHAGNTVTAVDYLLNSRCVISEKEANLIIQKTAKLYPELKTLHHQTSNNKKHIIIYNDEPLLRKYTPYTVEDVRSLQEDAGMDHIDIDDNDSDEDNIFNLF